MKTKELRHRNRKFKTRISDLGRVAGPPTRAPAHRTGRVGRAWARTGASEVIPTSSTTAPWPRDLDAIVRNPPARPNPRCRHTADRLALRFPWPGHAPQRHRSHQQAAQPPESVAAHDATSAVSDFRPSSRRGRSATRRVAEQSGLSRESIIGLPPRARGGLCPGAPSTVGRRAVMLRPTPTRTDQPRSAPSRKGGAA